jgi:hypothetical protein
MVRREARGGSDGGAEAGPPRRQENAQQMPNLRILA